jgi:hypothetical protein
MNVHRTIDHSSLVTGAKDFDGIEVFCQPVDRYLDSLKILLGLGVHRRDGNPPIENPRWKVMDGTRVLPE